MTSFLKIIASKLPKCFQHELRRFHYMYMIRMNKFLSEEPEFEKLDEWISEGDLVFDIGANVGHYTCRISEIVGDTGRVLAFEPVPETFDLLSSTISQLQLQNVTLINAAASWETRFLNMCVPRCNTGLDNYYMAQIVAGKDGLSVLSLPIDSLNISIPVKLSKIDVEGHELMVLKGMEAILKRDHPILIVEGESKEVELYLRGLGYFHEKLDRSPNRIYRY